MTGVILMGGKSSRMGQDKATLSRNGIPLFLYFYHLLVPHCRHVVLSVNENQHFAIKRGLPYIVDDLCGEGPMGGLVSCYRHLKQPLLLIPVDMPLLGEKEIKHLISMHMPGDGCTVFYDFQTELYEPMLGIWETDLLALAETEFLGGARSVQAFLHKQAVRKQPCPFPEKLQSTNTPDEWKNVLGLL